ncbi:MAG TPA: hypothetical protein VI278_03855 [Nitrososphaeraceae archaeon]
MIIISTPFSVILIVVGAANCARPLNVAIPALENCSSLIFGTGSVKDHLKRINYIM